MGGGSGPKNLRLKKALICHCGPFFDHCLLTQPIYIGQTNIVEEKELHVVDNPQYKMNLQQRLCLLQYPVNIANVMNSVKGETSLMNQVSGIQVECGAPLYR